MTAPTTCTPDTVEVTTPGGTHHYDRLTLALACRLWRSGPYTATWADRTTCTAAALHGDLPCLTRVECLRYAAAAEHINRSH
ncbi:hypothetical protein [Micromonospora carbonacea]|uniref:Uncharacterized protein n=1 Tax=Micromonospora carbonacea TaxID=47853 RepID=A0A1C5AAN1_9ACTN|nr:hypothetical protein [Micromonospora carbonacea]SCF42288.1 hypothetical protein GA0070563_11261 [Micromonospora carbonacea]